MVYLVYGIFPGTSCPQTQFFTMWSTSPTCPPQTPFTFGLNQRAPYTAGDRCLLCRCERKDSAVPPEAGVPGQNGTSQLKTPSALQLPLWVCSDCRRTVEKEDRHTALEQSLGVSVCVCENDGGVGGREARGPAHPAAAQQAAAGQHSF